MALLLVADATRPPCRDGRATRRVTFSPGALLAALAILPLVVCTAALSADQLAPAEYIDPDGIHGPDGIQGALVLCGGGRLPDAVREKFIELAGGRQAHLVIIPTASGDDTVADDGREVEKIWRSREPATITILHTRVPAEANDPAFVEPLKHATGVWITGGRQSQIAAAYSETLVEHELCELVKRGGVVGGTSAGAACQSRVMIVRGEIHKTPGLGLIPGAIVDQHFLARDRKARLFGALTQHPQLVGLGIDEGTALIVRGRTLSCLGDSTVTICLAAAGSHEATEVTLKSGETSDLTMLRRAARDRALAPFPPDMPANIEVPHGALVMAGGGTVPAGLVRKFIDLAGGPEALIIVLPTASPSPTRTRSRDAELFLRAGAKNVKVLRARRRDDIESPAFLESLGRAGGVWFGGGRQWRFVDAYEGTKAIDAFQGILRRGGVIGGSSAGATIQGELLVRGSPLGNEEMIAAGYERGFAFLPGTAIDQHFAQRGRFADMSRLVKNHPQLLGIGLDEDTALIVRGHTAEVVGQNEVHFFDRTKPTAEGEPDYISVGTGGKYDLKARRPE
jgi:cyanophycinase